MRQDMMKQTPEYHSLARLAVVQGLRSYGIKIKHWNSKQRPEAWRGSGGTLEGGKIFGTHLHALPQSFVPDYGNIPNFLVDICKHLEQHTQTEGLFRKSGSVVRLKLLKTKLDCGDNCLSAALPCDVAGLLKQFFRELPEPVLQADLQDALFKAQHLGTEEERNTATMLISCLMSDRTIHVLRYFFSFLHTVSTRSDENKMDSSNLAVIFAPNLLQSNDGSEKISASTEKKLRVHAAVVRTFIDQAVDIGCVPEFLLVKIPGMLGVDTDSGTPGLEGSEEGEGETPGERKKRRRRSVGDFVSGALNKFKTNTTPSSTPQADRTVLGSMVTPVILTPNTKRKLPVDSMQGISSKKRKSIKHNFAFDLLPSSLFGSGFTPASARCDGSPCVSLETSQSSLSPSVSGGKHLSSSGNRRSKRCENRKVQRVESGKTGCFSPKISRKEMVRRSLRLRFSLGKSSKDVNTLSVFPSSSHSQNIGWRLANTQELNTEAVPRKLGAPSTPAKSPFVSAGSKKISKSEDNLLTPKVSEAYSHRMSWTGPHPLELNGFGDEGTPVAGYLSAANCYFEPAVVAGKPPPMPSDLRSFSGSRRQDWNLKEDSLLEQQESQVEKTLLKIREAFSESESDLHKVVGVGNPPEPDTSERFTNSELQNKADSPATSLRNAERNERFDRTAEDRCIFSQGKDKALAVMEESTVSGPDRYSVQNSVTEDQREALLVVPEERTSIHVSCMENKLSSNVGDREIKVVKLEMRGCCNQNETCPVSSTETLPGMLPAPQEIVHPAASDWSVASDSSSCEPPPGCITARRSIRVSDQIQHFNKLSLSDRNSAQKLKSPLKFQRTPVRQSVRRINSLSKLKDKANSTGVKPVAVSSLMVKSVSYDGSLSSEFFLKHADPPSYSTLSLKACVSHEHMASSAPSDVGSRIPKPSLRNSGCPAASAAIPMKTVLVDLTNQEVPRATCNKKPTLPANRPNNTVLRMVSGRELNRYKGSPKNPIAKVTFRPSTKPLEL
ncbi:hypothetical protein FKM82_016378 [Ascaphus truei]